MNIDARTPALLHNECGKSSCRSTYMHLRIASLCIMLSAMTSKAWFASDYFSAALLTYSVASGADALNTDFDVAAEPMEL